MFKGKGQEPTLLNPRLVNEGRTEGVLFVFLALPPRPQQLLWIQISICSLGSRFLLDPTPALSEVHPSLIFI